MMSKEEQIDRLHKLADARLRAIDEYKSEIERLREALWQIDQWSRAYPLKIFPEPDLSVAAAVLAADGRVSLDAISASNMRYVVEGVGKIASAALEATHA